MDKITPEQALAERNSTALQQKAEKRALNLFHTAAEQVPAYRAFLRSERVDHKKIKTITDFVKVPVTDSKNYISAYPIEKRCWGGSLTNTRLIATSSGTSGEPKFWPRAVEQDLEAAVVHAFLYKEYFGADKRSTLILIGFPMGIYISGVATLLPTWLSSFRNNKATIMSIGNNKSEMLRAVRNLSDHYEQTILIGHPFFIKDVIETGAEEGIAWTKKHLGLMFCSEGFTEAWREYIRGKAGIAARSGRIFNTYGSSEMLLMGYETDFSIGLKSLAEKDPAFLDSLTGAPSFPQLFQYNPLLRYIESADKELVFTAASGIPLIRFNLHDQGNVFSFKDAKRAAKANEKLSVLAKNAHPFPLVSLWGRSNQTLKFYGVNIYPEHIKAGLMEKRLFHRFTGKFVMKKSLDRAMNQKWEINIELARGEKGNRKFVHEMEERIYTTLRRLNLEFFDMSSHIENNVRPIVKLRPYQDPTYFKPGLKPHYIDKNS